METNQFHSFVKQYYLFCILVGIGFFLFFFELGSRSFEIKDARRFAEITQEMMQDGNWLVLHSHGNTYMNKPPMLMWLIALFSSIGHQVTPLAARLPSAIAGLASIFMTYYFVQKFFNQRVAFIAAVILAIAQKIFEKIKDHVLDDTLNTLDVCTKKRQVTLIFRRNNQKMHQQ